MHEPVLSFGTDQFNRIFPFYLLISNDSGIASFGKSVAKLQQIEHGTLFADSFNLRSPGPGNADFHTLKKLAGQDIILDFARANGNCLHGQFEYLHLQDQLLFIGTPSVQGNKDGNADYTECAEQDLSVARLTNAHSDAEQQKQLEHQLRVNEKRYRDLFNYSQAFIFTHDLQGKLLSVNPALCEKMGYKKEELIGRMITDFIPRNDLLIFNTEYMDAVREKGSAKGIFRVNGKTDKKSFLLYQNFKVEEDDTEPYIIGFSQDITERIKIEKELRKNKKNTEEAARAKEFFLANMSHEIRTPLSGLLGIANLLSKTQLTEQQAKYTNLINSSANSLLSIVNDILDIEKIASGKFDLEHIPFKLEEKVLATIQSFQFKAEEKNVTLSFKSNVADDLVVIGDPSRLGQILNNLVSNALKFTNTGGIYVSVYYYYNDTKSTKLEFEVTDTGIGIKPGKLSDIFNPFVQATADTSRKFGGTGLGLSICKELIEMHGGNISVKSALNVGTTFTFLIPYEKGNAAMLKKENSVIPDFKSLKDIRVLVAEDWELNQFLVQYILES